MMFKTAVNFESDTQPVETVRDELEAIDLGEAARRAVHRAFQARTGQWRVRSLCVVVEELSQTRAKRPNKTGAASEPTAAS